MKKADIGMIGLGVMGQNLVMNMVSKGFSVAVYDRVASVMEGFTKNIIGADSVKNLVQALDRPRKAMMMIPAGESVDEMIEQLIAHMEPGDVIIDGGNSHFTDSIRRTAYVEARGLYYIGAGVSGGEEGALKGPSMMPGGSAEGWTLVKDIFQTICAKVADGAPCCQWIGENGAGHFVKMVHNGIEYGDMQLICEAYQLMRDVLGMSAQEMHEIFKDWNRGELNSYLIEITADILARRDSDGLPLVDKILDTSGQKGTGKWTSIAALEEGVPLTLIGEAVFSRFLSAMKDERISASELYKRERVPFDGDKATFIEDIRQALYAAKIISYAQGYSLMHRAAQRYGWQLDFGGIALIWRGGCIIRSAFLDKIKTAYDRNPGLQNLLFDPFFSESVGARLSPWRNTCAAAIRHGIPIPAMMSALAYFDGYTTRHLPANLLQAQRDYFGAHKYERADAPGGQFFHTDWTDCGGDKSK